MRVNHRWTEEEREYVRIHYKGDTRSARAIAEHLGVTFFSVKGQVHDLGLGKVSDYRKDWTPEEEERLAELAHTYCRRRISKLMHRGINSISMKIKHMNISQRIKDGWFNKREVSEILGVEHHWIQKRIDRGDLKASFHDGERPQGTGSRQWHIWDHDLADFIREHAMEIDGRNVDLQSIVWLLDVPRHGKPK